MAHFYYRFNGQRLFVTFSCDPSCEIYTPIEAEGALFPLPNTVDHTSHCRNIKSIEGGGGWGGGSGIRSKLLWTSIRIHYSQGSLHLIYIRYILVRTPPISVFKYEKNVLFEKKGIGAEIFSWFRPSPILWEPFKDSAPLHTTLGCYDPNSQRGHENSSRRRDGKNVVYSHWSQQRYRHHCFQNRWSVHCAFACGDKQHSGLVHCAIWNSFHICSYCHCQQLYKVNKRHRQSCVRYWQLGS